MVRPTAPQHFLKHPPNPSPAQNIDTESRLVVAGDLGEERNGFLLGVIKNN